MRLGQVALLQGGGVMSANTKKSVAFEEHFAGVSDPRRRKVAYPLVNILMIAVCAVLCGADDFVAIAHFGRAKKKFFKKFLDLGAGIPSHDRFNAIFRAIKPAEFEKCLLGWITALHEITDGQIVAIDGKTLRRSFDAGSGKAAIHMVSAWATANHVSLGQVVVDEKSNEITAIPKLLEMLELSGGLVTIDSMGCQTEIARVILDAGTTTCWPSREINRRCTTASPRFSTAICKTTLLASKSVGMKRTNIIMAATKCGSTMSAPSPITFPTESVGQGFGRLA